MADEHKTREQLCAELAELRQRVSILESRATEHQLREALRQREMLYHVSEALIAAREPEAMLRAFVAPLQQSEPYNVMLFYVYPDAAGTPSWAELVARNDQVAEPAIPIGTRYPIQHMTLGQRLLTNPSDILEIADIETDTTIDLPILHLMRQQGVRALLIVPLTSPDNRYVGFVNVNWKQPYHLDPQERQLYTILASQLAILIENYQLLSQTQESEARYRLLAENSTDMISRHTLDGIYLYASPISQALLGYEWHELIGYSAYEFFHPDDLQMIRRSHDTIRDMPVTSTVSYRIRRKDGMYIWFETTSRVVYALDTGQPQEIIAVSRNITERKQVEHALRDSEQRFRQIVETAAEGIWMLDAKASTTFVNQRMADMLGYTPAEMLGASLFEFMDDEGRALAKANLERRKQGIAEQHDFKFRRCDGSDLWAIVATTPILNQQKEYSGTLGMITDITERKMVEEQLRLLAMAVRQANDSITITDAMLDPPGPTIVFVNPAFTRLTGYGPEDIIGKSPRILQGERTDRMLLNRLRSALSEGKSFFGSTINYRKDGTEFYVEWRIAPIRNHEGIITNFIAVQNDITRRKESEERIRRLNKTLQQRSADLEAANKELETFSYSVSHDLRAPLRSIAGFSEALLEDYTDRLDAEGQDYLSRIIGATRRMGQLIDDLLGLAQMTRSDLHHEQVNLSEIVQSIATDLGHNYPQRRVRWHITPGVIAEGDPRLLRIALENLLGNAWKFTQRCDTAYITFDTLEHNGTTVYVVRDNGAGFDMVYASKLFGPFQRLHAINEFPGSGIGLATVQRIIHRHGGQIWAEGAIDQGASFYFTLQRAG